MILPKDLLSDITYYQYKFHAPFWGRPADIIIIYSNRFYLLKKVFKFNRIGTYNPITDTNRYEEHDEFIELNDQLKKYFNESK